MKWAREVGFKRNKQDPIYRLLVEQFDKNKSGELELREWGDVNRFMRSRGY